jgi:poly(A) polymerase
MPTADPKREFAVAVVRRLHEAGFRALWAGGCVRDLLMGRPPKDYDVATDARPDTVRNLFGHRRTLAVGATFGVIIVVGSKEAGNVEVATFRTEGPYLDGRRPEHVVFSTPEEDAQRRDFTINGMFYDPVAEKVHDYVGGEKDLGTGVLRAIGNPTDRMAEDKLRMLRAVRFAAALEFEIESATAEAVRAMAAEIRVVSAERIAQELRKMLVDPHRRRAIELTRALGLITEIVPECPSATQTNPLVAAARDWERLLHRLQLLNDPRFELAVAALLYDLEGGAPQLIESICKRLRLSNQETDDIVWLVRRAREVVTARAMSRAQLKRLLADSRARDLVELARVDALACDDDLSPVMHCVEFLEQTPPEEMDPPPFITGDDLVMLGLRPGKRFKVILEAVRDAQLNGEISNREEALSLARRLAAETGE